MQFTFPTRTREWVRQRFALCGGDIQQKTALSAHTLLLLLLLLPHRSSLDAKEGRWTTTTFC
jgi:hypothetical protein